MAVGLNNAAVMNWTKSLSLECAEDGILVTTVAPGSIETPRNFAIVSGRPTSPARVSMSSATRACATSRCTGLAERKKRLVWSSFSPQNIPVT